MNVTEIWGIINYFAFRIQNLIIKATFFEVFLK